MHKRVCAIVWIKIAKELLLPFSTALGVVLGGALGSGSVAIFTFGSPLATMQEVAQNLKLWGVVVAIGGTFPTIRAIETGLFDGQPLTLARQVLILLSAFTGASIGHWMVLQLTGGNE